MGYATIVGTMRQDKPRRDFRGRRWLTIALRSAHLAGVVLVGAALLGAGIGHQAGGLLMLATGLALYAVDLWSNPAHWGELAGVFIIVKLVLVAAMVLFPPAAAGLFWLLLIASAVVSHAPGDVRHVRVWG